MMGIISNLSDHKTVFSTPGVVLKRTIFELQIRIGSSSFIDLIFTNRDNDQLFANMLMVQWLTVTLIATYTNRCHQTRQINHNNKSQKFQIMKASLVRRRSCVGFPNLHIPRLFYVGVFAVQKSVYVLKVKL